MTMGDEELLDRAHAQAGPHELVLRRLPCINDPAAHIRQLFRRRRPRSHDPVEFERETAHVAREGRLSRCGAQEGERDLVHHLDAPRRSLDRQRAEWGGTSAAEARGAGVCGDKKLRSVSGKKRRAQAHAPAGGGQLEATRRGTRGQVSWTSGGAERPPFHEFLEIGSTFRGNTNRKSQQHVTNRLG